MKRPQPDIKDILLRSFIGNIATPKKLKKLWGTTTVNGVEVFKHRNYYWPPNSRSDKFEKLFSTLGIYEDVTTSDKKGIKSAWIYFNKNRATDLPVSYTDFVGDNLNQLWWDDADGERPDGLTLTTSLVIEELIKQPSNRTGRVETTDLLDPSAPTSTLITAIQNNYEELWDTCVISQEGVGVINKGVLPDSPRNTNVPDEDDLSPDDPWLQTLTRYALRDNGVTCTIKDVEIGYGKSGNRSYHTYVVTLEIPYQGFLFSLISDIADDLQAERNYTTVFHRALDKSYKTNGYRTKAAILGMDSSDLEDDPDLITRPYRLWENEAAEVKSEYNDIWLRSGGTWYLRVEPFYDPRAYGLTFKELNQYILQLIDTSYKKKKTKWYKKALAVIIFIIAIVFAPVTGGWSLNLINLAIAIAFASLVLTLFTLAFAAAGYESWATAFSEVSKTLEPLTTIAALVNIFASFQEAFKQAAKEAAKEAGKEIAEVTLTETLEQMITSFADNMIDNLIKGATDAFAGKVTALSLTFAQNLVKLLMLPNQLKLQDIRSKNKDLKAEYEEFREETARESDILQGFMRIYSKPATADWSIYAETFDMPYERGGGPLALGNVQRTTKQAIRRADYSDSPFDNILII